MEAVDLVPASLQGGGAGQTSGSGSPVGERSNSPPGQSSSRCSNTLEHQM